MCLECRGFGGRRCLDYEPKVATICVVCGGEIYEGRNYYDFGGIHVCCDVDCLKEYAEQFKETATREVDDDW